MENFIIYYAVFATVVILVASYVLDKLEKKWELKR